MPAPAFANLTELSQYNVAPEDLGKSRYVSSNDTWYEALYEGIGLDRWEARRTGTTPVLTALQDRRFLGFARDAYVPYARVALPGDGVAVSVPGPATGYLRCLTQVMVITDGASAASVSAKLQPADMIMWKAFAVAQFANTPTNSSLLTGNTGGVLLLGHGETYDVINANGSGASHMLYSYFDFPVGNITLVRKTFGATPVEIIPAAPTGYFNRFAFVGLVQGAAYNGATRAACIIPNVDTAAAQIQVYLGSNLVSNQSSAAANALAVLPVNADMAVTTEALKLATRAAVTANNLNVFAAYETIPLAA